LPEKDLASKAVPVVEIQEPTISSVRKISFFPSLLFS